MPVLTGSIHAHILTKPSRAGFAVIRLELIEPGTQRVFRGMAVFVAFKSGALTAPQSDEMV